MKKLISVFVLAIMAVSMLFAVAGCSDNSALLAEIEELKDRVEDLENKNNVFWTDKAEYAEDETMTVWFKDTAVFTVRIDHSGNNAFWASGSYINGWVHIKSLKTDISSDAVIATSYLSWENGTCLRNKSNSPVTLRKNVEQGVGSNFNATEALQSDTTYDFVICVPGTAFELARFKNIFVEK